MSKMTLDLMNKQVKPGLTNYLPRGLARLDVEVEGCFPSFPLLFSLQVQALPGRMLPLL